MRQSIDMFNKHLKFSNEYVLHGVIGTLYFDIVLNLLLDGFFMTDFRKNFT